MTTTNLRPTRPLDLSSHYLSYLDAIDTENQSRHLQGEPLMTYPTFEDFLDLCVEEALDPETTFGARAHESDSLHRVLDAGFCDEPDLKWILTVPSVGIFADERSVLNHEADDAELWISDYGTFAYPSCARH